MVVLLSDVVIKPAAAKQHNTGPGSAPGKLRFLAGMKVGLQVLTLVKAMRHDSVWFIDLKDG